MDPSFTQLLNEGLCEGNEEISSQPNLSQKKGRSKNFTIQEDMLLISAWENVSLDPIKGNNQTQATYWSRITSYFDEHKSFASERTSTALTNRWSILQKAVCKFQGFYNQIDGRNQSGIGEADKIRQTMEMYQDIVGSAFSFSHCWVELRHSPKFSSNISKKKLKTSPNDNLHTMGSSQNPLSVDGAQENEEEVLERPMGRKAAKKRKKMTNEPQNEASKTFFSDIQEHMSISSNKRRDEYETIVKIEEERLELKREQVTINKARERREQQMYEASIMATDTTNMESQMATFYNSLKAEILRKMQP